MRSGLMVLLVTMLCGPSSAKPRGQGKGKPANKQQIRGAVPSALVAPAATADVSRSAAAAPRGAPPSGRDVVQRESKIEFDERLVQGQTAQGAIYLFQRGESEFRTMVRVPGSFREKTLVPVFGDTARPAHGQRGENR